jgi:hypothetical protein
MRRALSVCSGLALCALVIGGLAGAAGCANPVQDAYIAELGPEDPAVPLSDIHRPGQPCLLCHGPYVGAQPEMSVAGTVYGYAWDPKNSKADPIPVEDVTVELSDSFGNSPPQPPKTNCAGNFYLTVQQWNPAYPLRVAIRYPVPGDPDGERVSMGTRISRDGSCASCHEGAPNQGSPGWVFCTQRGPDAPAFEEPETCTPSAGN